MLDSYTNSMCYESWRRSSYTRILIEIDACNDFSDNLVMAVPNLEGTGYTKETIRVEYEWKPSRCSTCLIFGHSLDDCSKAPKRVVNKMDKGNGGSSGVDDEGFVEAKKKKSSGNNRGNKNFKPVLVKPKPQYRPKAKQSTEGANQKTNPSVGKKNVSTSGNDTFSLSNSFEAFIVENSISEEVETGNKASSTPLVEK
ncbi:putative ribonuclease H-like domain-containing protein [Tanacetum coccineum]